MRTQQQPPMEKEKEMKTITPEAQEATDGAPPTTVPLPAVRPLLNPTEDDDDTEIVMRNGTVLVPHDYS